MKSYFRGNLSFILGEVVKEDGKKWERNFADGMLASQVFAVRVSSHSERPVQILMKR